MLCVHDYWLGGDHFCDWQCNVYVHSLYLAGNVVEYYEGGIKKGCMKLQNPEVLRLRQIETESEDNKINKGIINTQIKGIHMYNCKKNNWGDMLAFYKYIFWKHVS